MSLPSVTHVRRSTDALTLVRVNRTPQLCCVGQEMYKLPPDFVKSRMDRARSRLGVDCLDVVQFYWNDYGCDHRSVAQPVSAPFHSRRGSSMPPSVRTGLMGGK